LAKVFLEGGIARACAEEKIDWADGFQLGLNHEVPCIRENSLHIPPAEVPWNEIGRWPFED